VSYKAISLAALNIAGIYAGESYKARTSRSITGIESIYEMNKYTRTRSYNLLKIIYTCVKESALSTKKNVLICDYKKKQRNDRKSDDFKLKSEIYSYLVNALPLLPADLVKDYYSAIKGPNGMFRCFKILNDLFCRRTRRETRLRYIIDTYIESKKLSQSTVTHIGFFRMKGSTPDYFAINRNCKKFKCSKSSKNLSVFFLPREVLSLDQWFTFSIEFDKYLLGVMARYFKIKTLYKSFLDLCESLESGCSGEDSDDYNLDLKTCYINLKFYSFFIISSCIPYIKQHRNLGIIQRHILHCFGRGNVNATEVLGACFNLLNKKV